MVASVIANANRDQKKRPRPYEPHQFIPDWGEAAGVARPRMTPVEVADKVKASFAALAARAKARR